ncbi:conserved hypothetical protein [Sphingorhabdus sp. 109]|nr:conserved hypothetical protein [Sphingorhabdus sp. 109]
MDNSLLIVRLFCGFRHGVDRHIFAAELALVEFHLAINEREQGVVLAHADIATRMGLRATLADDDVTGDNGFATEFLDAQATTF